MGGNANNVLRNIIRETVQDGGLAEFNHDLGHTYIECCCCTENWPEGVAMTLFCGHTYCSSCLGTMFRNFAKALDSPPKCCKSYILPKNNESPDHITATVASLLGKDLEAEYWLKLEEWESANETYGSNTLCAKYIPAACINEKIATCPSCSRETCNICKKCRHVSACPDDSDLKEIEVLAREKEWKKCVK
ncbi:hypothetical protein B0T22DRAFT_479884 [Podospora appendiculata]|uniref:RING-type domain-containing protein n=1 Tax=Podospora appendiculata TaxID=314037 RepID=A0AAE1CCL4_9PEZI|nr:hypothetical protein B0T22DRAFT_479884 [Podospora appendiculata]